MPDFNAFETAQVVSTARTRIARNRHAQICKGQILQITIWIEVLQVLLLDIGAADSRRHVANFIVQQQLHFAFRSFTDNRPDIARRQTRFLCKPTGIGQNKFCSPAIFNFNLIDISIAAHKSDRRLVVRHVEHGLDHVRRLTFQLQAHLLDTFAPGVSIAAYGGKPAGSLAKSGTGSGAFSTFAAKSQLSHDTIASSPESANT